MVGARGTGALVALIVAGTAVLLVMALSGRSAPSFWFLPFAVPAAGVTGWVLAHRAAVGRPTSVFATSVLFALGTGIGCGVFAYLSDVLPRVVAEAFVPHAEFLLLAIFGIGTLLFVPATITGLVWVVLLQAVRQRLPDARRHRADRYQVDRGRG